jgi:hypothetical protein
VANTGLPTVAGTAKVGSTLTAGGGTWNPNDVTRTYQWLSNGAPIGGATAATYRVAPSQVGKQLSVRVTAAKAGLTSAAATSKSTGKVAAGTITVSKKPSIGGKAKVGKSLTLKAGTFAPGGTKVTIQWYANGKKIKAPTQAAVETALQSLSDEWVDVNAELQPGWAQLASVSLDDDTAVASALDDLDSLAQAGEHWSHCQQALQVIVAATRAQEGLLGTPEDQGSTKP